jgi:hypothetical protein
LRSFGGLAGLGESQEFEAFVRNSGTDQPASELLGMFSTVYTQDREYRALGMVTHGLDEVSLAVIPFVEVVLEPRGCWLEHKVSLSSAATSVRMFADNSPAAQARRSTGTGPSHSPPLLYPGLPRRLIPLGRKLLPARRRSQQQSGSGPGSFPGPVCLARLLPTRALLSSAIAAQTHRPTQSKPVWGVTSRGTAAQAGEDIHHRPIRSRCMQLDRRRRRGTR